MQLTREISYNEFVKRMQLMFQKGNQRDAINMSMDILDTYFDDNKKSYFIELIADEYEIPKYKFVKDNEEQLSNVVFNEEGIFVTSGLKKKHVCNFTFYPKFKIHEEITDQTYWLLQIHRYGESREILRINHDDWSSAKGLRKALLKYDYHFKGSDNDLMEIQEYLGKTPTAPYVLKLGHLDDAGYFFSNVMINRNGEIIEPNELGIVKSGTNYYYMPYVNKQPFYNAKRFKYVKNEINFNDWANLMLKAHHEHAILPIAFYISSLFRDYSFGKKEFAPIMYLKGTHGTGKSSIARNITALFGYEQKTISIKHANNTPKSLPRLMAQMRNAVMWIDEYHNDISKDLQGALQSFYDGSGYEMAQNTQGIETNSITPESQLFLSSNYIPADPIFVSRLIIEIVDKKNKTKEQRDAYGQLNKLQEEGLSEITVELIRHRKFVLDKWEETFNYLFEELQTRAGNTDIGNRAFENMAYLLTPMYILLKYHKIHLQNDANFHKKLFDYALDNILKQHELFFQNSELSQFFYAVLNAIQKKQILENMHYKVSQGKLYFKFKDFYGAYYEREKPAKTRTEIHDLILNDNCFIEKKNAVRFYDSDGANYVTSAYIMDYSKLVKQYGFEV